MKDGQQVGTLEMADLVRFFGCPQGGSSDPRRCTQEPVEFYFLSGQSETVVPPFKCCQLAIRKRKKVPWVYKLNYYYKCYKLLTGCAGLP